MRALWILPLLIAACAAPGRDDSRVDMMFRDTGATGDVFTLATPSLVNELNGAFSITDAGWFGRAVLDEAGQVKAGESRVFVLDFIDHGDSPILRTDDKRLSLRAELGPEGKVLRGLLGAAQGRVTDGFGSYGSDEFQSGTWQLLYEGPDLVVGRLDMQFRRYRVAGNFRVPRLR